MNYAIFTICRHEYWFAQLWYNYYSEYCDNLFILDNGFNNLSGIPAKCILPTKKSSAYDLMFLCNTVSKFQHELLKSYDAVLFAEADEIVWHKIGLDNYIKYFIKCMKLEVISTNGYNIYSVSKKRLNLTWPILRQKSLWYHNHKYDKPLLSKKELNWHTGFHRSEENIVNKDPSLYLIHLKHMDYTLWNIRAEQNKKHTKPDFTFYSHSWDNKDFDLEEIPEFIKDAI